MSTQQGDAPVVRELAIYPVRDQPGRSLARTRIESVGLAGDRRKKRPVHLVGAAETPQTTRANVFLDIDDEQVGALLERTVRIGDAELLVTERPSGCPGVYAVVVTPGDVAVGDPLRLASDSDS